MVHLGKAEVKEAGESPPYSQTPHNLPRDPATPDPARPPKLRISKPQLSDVPGTGWGDSGGVSSRSPPQHCSTGSNRPLSQQQGRGMVTVITRMPWWLKGLPGEALTPPTGPFFGAVGALTISPHLWIKGFYGCRPHVIVCTRETLTGFARIIQPSTPKMMDTKLKSMSLFLMYMRTQCHSLRTLPTPRGSPSGLRSNHIKDPQNNHR